MDYKKAITTLMLQGFVWVPVISAHPIADMASNELGCEVIVAKHNYKSDYARLFVKMSPTMRKQKSEMYENIVRYKCQERGMQLRVWPHYIELRDENSHATFKTWKEVYEHIS